ncbi:major facilitator superfamily domain-containing protein [Dactylonectria macrodidyma]|uniref:Major facilitator superfamily domain-containing protein n=1 Tax=Dactylonectria macrodidyma TaxID=307937 RepID=A0A9P9FFH3_9HYPO|nr:major facilitator superfamily domain-containing protein [Dactylonectria macrodidyma]
MAWGILEVASGQGHHVPGTVLLEEQSDNIGVGHIQHVKKVVHKNETVILVPQPSDDPNDPLNSSLLQRDLQFLLFAYCGVLIIGGIGPILASFVPELMTLFNVSLADVSLLTGYSLCATGASGIVISAATRKYGKRPTLLFSVVCAFVGTVWGGAAQSYDSLMGARVVQGLSVSMFESIFFAIVGDLYYVHERGFRTSIVTTVISGISNLPAVLAGKITTDLGWRWVFWLLSIFLGIGLVLAVLFGWETAYNRKAIYNTDVGSQDNLEKLEEKRAAMVDHVEGQIDGISMVETATSTAIKRQSFLTLMKPYSETFTDEPLWKLIIAPITILSNPVVIWAVTLMSFPTLWLVAINLLTAQIFSAPPFLLNTTQLGYFSAGPTVGGFLGALIAGLISDPLIKFCSRRNQGVYEPEFRLFLIMPGFVCSAISYFLFGYLIEQGKSPVAMSALWGIATAALQFIMMAIGTYCVDAYRAISVEIFIATMIVKNFVLYGFSYFINDWIVRWGPAKMFYAIAGIQLALCLTTVPLYMYGKKLRAWWHKA